ncbi:hypothetical protein Pf1_02000 [Flavobacterium columnare]|nr:hypothetical protein Pf1_02000 [Flavobacterium columnare]
MSGCISVSSRLRVGLGDEEGKGKEDKNARKFFSLVVVLY